MRFTYLLVSTVLALLPLSSLAIPTGLNVMPTAEILPMGASRIDYEFNNSRRLFVPVNSPTSVVGTQGGMVPGVMEGGVDSVSGFSTVYNAKMRIKGESLLMPALAIGVQNVGAGRSTQLYAVASKAIPGIGGLHAGILRDADDSYLTMIGADVRLAGIRIMADRIQGNNRPQRTSMGLEYQIREWGIRAVDYDITTDTDAICYSLVYSYQ